MLNASRQQVLGVLLSSHEAVAGSEPAKPLLVLAPTALSH